MQDEVKGRSESQLEAWFLESLESKDMPVDHMLVLLAQLASSGKKALADNWAEFFQDQLKERGDRAGMLLFVKSVSKWKEIDSSFRTFCKNALLSVFKDRLGAGFITAAGFDQSLPVSECLRRFEILNELQPGRFCYDKTWGFGVVQRLDDFYQKVTIDFDSKKDHQMSFAYACEALQLISNNHILTVKYSDPKRLDDLVGNNPAEVVKMAIRSYGPASAPRLKELLVPIPVKEEDWKNFWDGARKSLKNDPLVDLPLKRNDPICLREKHREYGEEWFTAFKAERDIDRIFELVSELESAVDDLHETGRRWKEPLVDRFAFVAKGSRGRRPDIVARIVMTARRFGLDRVDDGGIDGVAITRTLFEPDQFLGALSRIPARELGPLVSHMSDCDAGMTADVMFSLIPRMAINVLSETMSYLLKAGRESDCADYFRSALSSKKAGPTMLLWVCRNVGKVGVWGLVNVAEILAQVLDDLKEVKSGDSLKAQNQLKLLLAQKDWLESVLGMMTVGQRNDFVVRVNGSRALDDATKRSLLALVIRINPDLKKVISGDEKESAEIDVSRKGRLTSWRSFRERHEQYRILVEKRIPENSRDIAVARSYGDLRENHEYKTAKEMQGIFLKRKGEMETDLQKVKGTDFAGLPVDRVGMGTCVTVRRPDGGVSEFAVLGEWDRDEALGIISSDSRVAKLMEGLREGDEVMLPMTGDGALEERCRIEKIDGLSDQVRQWISGDANQEKS